MELGRGLKERELPFSHGNKTKKPCVSTVAHLVGELGHFGEAS